MEKLRLWIASIIDRLHPNVCWCDLVLWAKDCHSWGEIDWTGKCKKPPLFDDNWGGCYCGKFRMLHDVADKIALALVYATEDSEAEIERWRNLNMLQAKVIVQAEEAFVALYAEIKQLRSELDRVNGELAAAKIALLHFTPA